MTLTTLLISIAVLTLLVLIALKMALDRKEVANSDSQQIPLIRMSGIYSILRQSPREDLTNLRPNEKYIRQYLTELHEDINGVPLDDGKRAALLKHWKVQMEVNLLEIETGDKNGAAFYYYDYTPHTCPVCAPFIRKGNFVTREEIFNNPQIIPPFHLGCTCALSVHPGVDNRMKETTMGGMVPFFESDAPPPLPEWENTISLTVEANT